LVGFIDVEKVRNPINFLHSFIHSFVYGFMEMIAS